MRKPHWTDEKTMHIYANSWTDVSQKKQGAQLWKNPDVATNGA